MKSSDDFFQLEALKAEAQLQYIVYKLLQKYGPLIEEKPVAAHHIVKHEFIASLKEISELHSQLVISYESDGKEIEVTFVYRADHNQHHSCVFKVTN